jgi:hypothetical protein
VFENFSDGDTWFSNQEEQVAGTDTTLAFAAGDTHGDGRIDLVESTVDRQLVWRRNSGTVHFLDPTTISATAPGASALAPADFDRDGDLDLLAASPSGDMFRIFENLAGDGSSWTVHTLATSADGPSAVSADDDADGDLDAVGASCSAGQLVTARNDRLHGQSLFGAVRSLSTTPLAILSLEVADLDGDGDPDPLVADLLADAIVWWSNSGDASAWELADVATSAGGTRIATAGDLDRDGDLDVVGASDSNGDLEWYRSAGAGGFATFAIDFALEAPTEIALADFDRTKRLDVAVGDESLEAVFWYKNDGTPATGSWTRLTVATALTGFGALALEAADGDGDGDLVTDAQSAGDVLWLDRDGAATPNSIRRTLQTLSETPNRLVAADLDRDGDLDLAVETGEEVFWLESDATPAAGAWTLHTAATGLPFAEGIAAADLDGDGDPDLVLTTSSPAAVALLENAGAGWVDSVDFDRDGDGDLDVASAAALGGTIDWTEILGTKLHDDGFDSDGDLACWSASVP